MEDELAQDFAGFVVETLEEHEFLSEAWDDAGTEARRILTGVWLARFSDGLAGQDWRDAFLAALAGGSSVPRSKAIADEAAVVLAERRAETGL